MIKSAIIWGATGHAKVIYPILKDEKYQILALIDNNPEISKFLEHTVFHSFAEYLENMKQEPKADKVGFAIAIGGTLGKDRMQIHKLLVNNKFTPINIFHPTSWVGKTAKIMEGAQILAMAAVCEDTQIGMQTIVNTNASVDHECIVGSGVHIMPGATIAGCVEIGDYATIGSNATILPRLKIGKGAIIGAGAVVTNNVPENTTVLGVPARIQENR